MKTHAVKAKEIERAWHVVDADGMVLGRLATQVASLLRGKHKPIYSPNMDTGDFVIIVNAAKVRVTGSKETDKNTTMVFPAPLMITIQELGTFLAQETSAVAIRRAPAELRGA